MTYGLTATSKIASEKQLAFINTLINERSTEGTSGDTHETIMNVTGAITVTSSEASSAISDLLSQPKVIKTVDQPKIAAAASGGIMGDVPLSKYAVEFEGKIVFLAVAEFKGTRYLRELIGAPGDWQKIKPVGARRAGLVYAIKAVGPKVAALRYADEFTCCAACGSPLSDELSRARGIGPICWSRF